MPVLQSFPQFAPKTSLLKFAEILVLNVQFSFRSLQILVQDAQIFTGCSNSHANGEIFTGTKPLPIPSFISPTTTHIAS